MFPNESASIIWRRLDAPGHDAATLSAFDGGVRLEGAAAFLESGLPCHLRYRVELDDRWHTRMADVRGWLGAARIDLEIRVVANREWLLNDAPVPGARGCIDVDLAFTPATNLLPIRRLNLPVGGSAPVVAAWLPFPNLELRPLDQVYRRTSDDTYEYSSAGGTFKAGLLVSPHGFVTHYSGLWREERG